MASSHKTQVLIIGSGPAGYTAAIYAARAGRTTMLVSGIQPGGQLTITTDVENFPGFADPVQGPWLMDQMSEQAKKVGTIIANDTIASIDLSSRPFKAVGESSDEYVAETVIIATGAQAKWLGLESESFFQGFGVSGCATCDGFFFRNKEVVVVGGGNTAVEEAIYLTNHASKVTLIHRRDSLRADQVNQKHLFSNPKINVIWDTVVEEIMGTTEPKNVTSIKLKNVKTNELSTMKTDGVFVAIGHSPYSGIFKGQLTLDDEGYIITKPGSTETNIPGVFAAGDVQDKIYRQAVTAAGTGCIAALLAHKFITEAGA
ncbi:MAG: thioredoxin-disulfide reductase [Alphaproteobacteria bacterium]|nr:thioredoxin-disulfide reductase [Candidatus Jidaibacter sp.]